MRLLIISDLYEPVINGVATFSKSLAVQMTKRGHEVCVIAPSQTGKPYTEQDPAGFTIERIRSVRFKPYQNIYACAGMYLPVSAVFDKFQPDIVHLQTPLGLGWDGVIAAKRRKVPIVATLHVLPDNLINNIRGMKYFASGMDYALRKYGLAFLKQANAVTIPTKLALDVHRPKNLKMPILPMTNGVDLSDFAPAAKKPAALMKKFKIPEDKKIILFVGRADPEKCIELNIKALQQLREQGHDYHLVVVGKGSDIPRLKKLALEHGVHRNVTFTGRVSDEDLKKIYHIGDVYAIASKAELQCIAALEAMACGLPVAVVRAGALPALCDEGKNGFIFEPDDATSMAEAIQKVLTASKATTTAMGKHSRQLAAKHDVVPAIGRFEQLYLEQLATTTPALTSSENDE